jgi:hypothetical protein
MNNDSIDFKAVFGEGPFADVTDGTVNGGKPCRPIPYEEEPVCTCTPEERAFFEGGEAMRN